MDGLASVATLIRLATAAALLPKLVTADVPFHHDINSYQDGDLGEKPQQTFRSAPDIVAPIYQVNTFDVDKVDTQEPYIFMTGNYGGWGPSIVSSKDLSLVWAGQTYHALAQTARSWENFKGQRVMSVWADDAVRIFDQGYNELYAVRPQGTLKGSLPDSHEGTLTEDNTVVMISCPRESVDLRPLGGKKDGGLWHCQVQEVDPETNEVLFHFKTLDFFSIEDSYWELDNEDDWDFAHMNSAMKTPNGDFLISYRHLSCIILVDGKTTKVKWAMWGKKNMFTDTTINGSAVFHWQHEPRVTGNTRFTLFDNHDLDNGFCNKTQCSRGLEVEYDPQAMTVRMINEWYHPQSLISASRGGVQRTPSGNVAVAWGQNPMYTEYTPDGEVAMDVQRGQVLTIPHGIFDVITYRIWKGQWVGNPSWGPNISCDGGSQRKRQAYVSWNGATEVAKWALLLSNNKRHLDGSKGVHVWSERKGFETELPFWYTKRKTKFARVAAVDRHGVILGATPVVDLKSGKLHSVKFNVTTVDHDAKLDDKDNGDESMVSGFVIGLAGLVLMCIGLTLVMLFCRRQRRSKVKARLDVDGDKSEATHGLLAADGAERHEVDGERFDMDEPRSLSSPRPNKSKLRRILAGRVFNNWG